MDRDVEEIRRRAQERVAGRSSMVMDGDVIEELARAHERHAQRVREAAAPLGEVGRFNHLGETTEGRTVTAHYRASASDGPDSLKNSMVEIASAADKIVGGLRAVAKVLGETESDSVHSIENARGEF